MSYLFARIRKTSSPTRTPRRQLWLIRGGAEQMIIVYGQVFNMFGNEYHNRDVAKLRAKGARSV